MESEALNIGSHGPLKHLLPVIPSLQPPGESMATATRDGPRPPDAPRCPRIFSGDQRDSQVLFRMSRRFIMCKRLLVPQVCTWNQRIMSHELRLHVTSWRHVSAHRTDFRLQRADGDRSKRTGLPVFPTKSYKDTIFTCGMLREESWLSCRRCFLVSDPRKGPALTENNVLKSSNTNYVIIPPPQTSESMHQLLCFQQSTMAPHHATTPSSKVATTAPYYRK